MDINGIPLHPLVVHAAVVFVPLTAVLAALALVPRWRATATYLAAAAGLLAAAFSLLAEQSGEDLLDRVAETDLLELHEELAEAVVPLSLAAAGLLAVLALVSWGRPASLAALNARLAAHPRILTALRLTALAVALAATIQMFFVGETGAQSVWGGR